MPRRNPTERRHQDALQLKVASTLSWFRKAEDGSLTLLALLLVVMMIMMGGLAVDIMRYEATRTTLQNTLDRATLASASLSQTLDPESVVNDYFAKAGMTSYLKDVTVTEGLNFRNVSADASADTKPYFLHMMGIEDLDANGHSMAEQRINNVEIMLVLDVSGSMASNSRLTNLKTAAKEFVNTVLSSDPEKRISIGIVPFNGQVNLPSNLLAKYNVTDNPGITNSTCLDLPASTYSAPGISTTTALPMTTYSDSYSTTSQSTSYVTPTDSSNGAMSVANVWCPAYAGNQVSLPNQTIATLKTKIDALTAIGATSINAGMKWGLALLDPGARNMYTSLITAGAMPTTLSGRPFEYDDKEAMKVIVLMTDGENFAEERINSPYKSGLAPIYKSNSDSNYSVYHSTVSGSNKYWVPHLGTWQAVPWSNSKNNGTYVQQTWQQVWSTSRVAYVAWQFYARALGGSSSSSRTTYYNTWMANFRTQTATTTMDTQLQAACNQAKSKDVIVYGIAFEASTNGQTQIKNCATSAGHYFNATGLQITSAFRSIANNISQLRLTQ